MMDQRHGAILGNTHYWLTTEVGGFKILKFTAI